MNNPLAKTVFKIKRKIILIAVLIIVFSIDIETLTK